MADCIQRRCRGMDGRDMFAGDKAVCLALPKKEPALVVIRAITEDGKAVVWNGRIERAVDPEACIPSRAYV